MPLLRINATPLGLAQHEGFEPICAVLRKTGGLPGPAIIMVHGYKYAPGHPHHCPHSKILGSGDQAWPAALGVVSAQADQGLGIAFGWHARRPLRAAHRLARDLGQSLAQLITLLRAETPDRPVHIIAHSLGSETTLSALQHLPEGSVNRILLLTGASYVSHANAMLCTPAGRRAEVFNITSRENDLFDLAFERLITKPCAGDTALGRGITADNALTLQLDCPSTLAVLAQFGLPVAASARRVCHWSSYTRPGIMALYARLLRQPAALSFAEMAALLPPTQTPRWSRLWASASTDPRPDAAPARWRQRPLAPRLKNRIMALPTLQGKDNEPAY